MCTIIYNHKFNIRYSNLFAKNMIRHLFYSEPNPIYTYHDTFEHIHLLQHFLILFHARHTLVNYYDLIRALSVPVIPVIVNITHIRTGSMYRIFLVWLSRLIARPSPTVQLRAINQTHHTHIPAIYLCVSICRFTFCTLTASVNVLVRWQLPLPHSSLCADTNRRTNKTLLRTRVRPSVCIIALRCSICVVHMVSC